MDAAKPFAIPKQLVWQAYLEVKSKGGAAGVDHESLEDFERNLKKNLYRIWNRMSSGSYFPPAVKAVPIPKKSGGTRILGVPTVSDRIAQTVVKLLLEPILEPVFDENSFGYRPGKSAHDAIAVTRKRCWQYDWVVEFDIRGLFDNINHDMLMKALRHHCDCRWVLLYVERWLKAPLQQRDGSLTARDKGTPQGGVVSPILANLFLHYAFDAWVRRRMPRIPFCRYADDGLLHCKSRRQAEYVMRAISKRFRECGLEIHPDKSCIVYCKDVNRQEEYPRISFTFLGYTFRPRRCVDKKRDAASELPAGDQPLRQEGDQPAHPQLACAAQERQDFVGSYRGCSIRFYKAGMPITVGSIPRRSANCGETSTELLCNGCGESSRSFRGTDSGRGNASTGLPGLMSASIRSLGAWRIPSRFE